MSELRTEWTAWVEAISWVSATLGESFTMAQDNGLHWSTLAVEQADGLRGYPVGLERIGSEVKIIVDLNAIGGNHADMVKIWAIVGWANSKGHMVQVE